MSSSGVLRTVLAWTALVGLVVVIFRITGGLSPLGILVLIALVVATFVVGARRARRTLGRIQHHLAMGEPEALLALVDRRLARTRHPTGRAPLLVFRAAGLSMRGQWPEALAVLDEVDPEVMPEPGKEIWQFGYWGARFGCLIFCERIAEARRVLDHRIEPLARGEKLKQAGQALEAARAELWFCEGEPERARPVFQALVDDPRVPPASRAVFHYFLGRIERDAGRPDADRHLDRAAELAPHTWLPAGVEAIRREAL